MKGWLRASDGWLHAAAQEGSAPPEAGKVPGGTERPDSPAVGQPADQRDALPRPVRGGSDVKTLLLLALAAVVGAVVLSNQDDIRRYMKMRNM